MREERMQVLQMLSDGRINADQASELLDALGFEPVAAPQSTRREHAAPGRYQERRHGRRGKDLPPAMRDILEARIHGVDSRFVEEMREIGFGSLSLNELKEFRMFGVTPDYIRELRELGLGDLSPKQIAELRMHGVTQKFIREMVDLGYVDLDVPNLMRMHSEDDAPETVENEEDER